LDLVAPISPPTNGGYCCISFGHGRGLLSLLILLVTNGLEAAEIIFGIVLAAAAIGATIASLISARLTNRFLRRTVMTNASAITGLSVIAAGVVTSQWQLIIVWTLNGAGGRSFIQRHTPNDCLGRAAVASRMITRTSFVVGALLGGIVATTTSVRWAFVVAGLVHLVGSLLLWRSFREEPV
jgi:MFS family permease